MQDRRYVFASSNLKVVQEAIFDALEQVLRYPRAVARESGLRPSDIEEAAKSITETYRVEPHVDCMSAARISVVVSVLPTALQVVHDVWETFVVPWLCSKSAPLLIERRAESSARRLHV